MGMRVIRGEGNPLSDVVLHRDGPIMEACGASEVTPPPLFTVVALELNTMSSVCSGSPCDCLRCCCTGRRATLACCSCLRDLSREAMCRYSNQ